MLDLHDGLWRQCWHQGNHGNSQWHRFKWGWTNPADQTHQCEEELSPRHRFGCTTRALSTGCLPKDLLFFSLQNFRPINHNRQFLKGPEVFGFFFPLCFFFDSPVLSASLAICSILELEIAISTVFCTILECEPLVFRGICNILVLDLFMSHGILQLGFILTRFSGWFSCCFCWLDLGFLWVGFGVGLGLA